ncbi:tyrosine-type recombinase/integrase [Candidatus Woesearchaeota archaeon]|nr:tyrosine-type recombinase/integrase [Candidatus Woesearchaeota archaeon]
MSDKNLKPSSVNLALCSLRFFYQEVLEKEIFNKIKSPKLEKKLPTVLTKDEVRALLAATKNKKHHLLIEMLYSAGLRASEAVSLKVNDLDLTERIGRVISGKGKKDRLIILSNNLVEHIEKYLKKREKKGYKSEFLFHVKDPNKHLSVRQAQKIIQKTAKKAGINKRVFCHALRSSFATHLLESGVDIRIIQELLGHANLQTTQRYTQVSTEEIKKVKSPLDNL